ncbi:MAG: agmatine deiminase family protein [Bacteroidota bacterium]
MNAEIFAQNIIPEWNEPKGLVLVYPANLPTNPNEPPKKTLINFYDSFIQLLLDSSDLSEITIIHRKGLKELLTKKFPSKRIMLIEINDVQDIWARDFMPIYLFNETVCKALYNPSYFKEKEIKYAVLDNQVGINLAEFLHLKIDYFIQSGKQDFILDGGNFIHNGQGTAIVTNRVIADNETLSIDEIKQVFKSKLNISNLIILPVEPGDETGHIDGMVRFANEQTVFIASYPDKYVSGVNNIKEEDYKTDKQFLENITDTLRKNKFEVIRIENAIPQDNGEKKMPSAFGNYINFLRIGNTIFLPQYTISQDSKATETIKKSFPNLTIVPITTDIDKLSRLGGVLNCISWTYY